jgi:hypothetical protein
VKKGQRSENKIRNARYLKSYGSASLCANRDWRLPAKLTAVMDYKKYPTGVGSILYLPSFNISALPKAVDRIEIQSFPRTV